MLTLMDTANIHSEPIKNQSETKTQKQKGEINSQRSLEITYSKGKRRFISFYET